MLGHVAIALLLELCCPAIGDDTRGGRAGVQDRSDKRVRSCQPCVEANARRVPAARYWRGFRYENDSFSLIMNKHQVCSCPFYVPGGVHFKLRSWEIVMAHKRRNCTSGMQLERRALKLISRIWQLSKLHFHIRIFNFVLIWKLLENNCLELHNFTIKTLFSL